MSNRAGTSYRKLQSSWSRGPYSVKFGSIVITVRTAITTPDTAFATARSNARSGKIEDMPAKPKDADTKFSKPAEARNLKPPDGHMRLSNCTLQDALDSAYATFASNFGGLGYPTSKTFFEENIPAMVFELAVGAGWLPITEAALTPDEVVWEGVKNQDPVYKGRNLVLFGDLMIDVWYKEAFMALLEDSIDFTSHDPTNRKDRLDSLPKFTTKADREKLLQDYLKAHAADQPKVGMLAIAEMAAVDYRDFKRWRKGPPTDSEPRGLPDSSIKAKRIAILLRYDDRSQTPKYKPSPWLVPPPL